jgi:hypothetical protein
MLTAEHGDCANIPVVVVGLAVPVVVRVAVIVVFMGYFRSLSAATLERQQIFIYILCS